MAISRSKEPSEKEIEEQILYWLNCQYQCFAFKLNLKGTWNPRLKAFMKLPRWVPLGGADIIVCLAGMFGCFEVKIPSAYKAFFAHPGPHEIRQQAFLHQIRSKGGFAEVVCSLQQVEDYVATLVATLNLKLNSSFDIT